MSSSSPPWTGLRPFRCIKRQAHYRSSVEERQLALCTDQESVTRYCALTGRTGGIGLCCPIQTESGVYMSNCVINNWKWQWRIKVRYGGLDNVTAEAETSMRVAWPNMHAMFQDPLHPCFKLEHGLKIKRIEETAKFRQIMSKFSALNTDIPPEAWGPFYRCEMDPPPYTPAESTARRQILDQSMAVQKATSMMETHRIRRTVHQPPGFFRVSRRVRCCLPIHDLQKNPRPTA